MDNKMKKHTVYSIFFFLILKLKSNNIFNIFTKITKINAYIYFACIFNINKNHKFLFVHLYFLFMK